jgi:FMN phosphatase YigB (HAD superfamily)
VDDSQVNCEGARQAGMRALLYRSNDQIQQNLTELLQ